MSDTSSPASDPAHADIGIVCAMKLEIAPFLDRCDRVRKYTGGEFVFRGGRCGTDYDIRVAIVESRPGAAYARRATQALLDAHTPAWVISAGFAGGLVDVLQLGDIVMANSIVDRVHPELKVDVKMAAEPDRGWHVGRLVTIDHVARTIAEKKELAGETEAIAADMESYSVAQVCQERKTRFLAVRSISDDLTEDLPPEVLTVLGRTGSRRAGAIAGALWKRPASAKELWRLREQAASAADRLAAFLMGIVPTLYETTL